MRISERPGRGPAVTLVLVHGSGHTARVWGPVQSALAHASVAVDLPGRADRCADIADVALDDAAASLARDVDGATAGPLVLVGHSAGGIVLPALAARLAERVVGLAFVAGLSAKHGETVMATVRPEAEAFLAERLAAMRKEFAGCMLEPDPSITSVAAQFSISSACIGRGWMRSRRGRTNVRGNRSGTPVHETRCSM